MENEHQLIIAANNGDPKAQFQIGFMYYLDASYTMALEWLEKSADQKNDQAQLLLGFMHEKGFGVEQNLDKAIEYYTMSANQSNAEAQHRLGSIFRRHDIGAKWWTSANHTNSVHSPETLKWWTLAATQNHVPAQHDLGIFLYEKGDMVESLKWFIIAAQQGHNDDAATKVIHCKNTMTIAEVNEAQKRASEFGKK